MKRIIYIGDYSGQTIYFDTKKKVILKTKSSSLLNSEKTKNSPKQVVMIITGLILFQPLLQFLLVQFDLVDHNVGLVPFFVLFGYSLVAIGLSWLVYIALYGNSKNLELASKQEFRRAVASNNFGQFMGVSTGSKKFLWAKVKNIFLMSCVIMVGILSLFVITTVFDVQLSFTDAISGVMAGIGPALIFIIFWLNNPFRWLLIVERFAKNKIDWAPEAFEFSESLKKKKKETKNAQ